LSAESIEKLMAWMTSASGAQFPFDALSFACSDFQKGASIAGAVGGASAGMKLGSSLGSWLGESIGGEKGRDLGTNVGGALGSAVGTVAGWLMGARASFHFESSFKRSSSFQSMFHSPKSAFQQCLQLLSVSAQCSHVELRAAFRRAALQAHPDRNGGSNERMVQLNTCYQIVLAKRGFVQ
jgi:hypothetical protein